MGGELLDQSRLGPGVARTAVQRLMIASAAAAI
jgi:hypothetical protein